MNIENISLGNFVQQLLLQLGDDELHFKDERPWHELFYQLKTAPDEPGKPRFLKDLFFDWNGMYPRSQELSEYLDGLHWTGCVSASNPSYDKFKLSREVGEQWRTAEIEPHLREFVVATAHAARNELAVGNAR